MRIIVTSSIQQPTLLSALREVPSARIIFEQLDTVDYGNRVGTFWVEADDYDVFEAAMADDPTVTAVECLATFNDRRLYRAEQMGDGRERSVYPTIVEVGGVIQRMVGTSEGWEFQVAFPSQEAASRFHEVCADYDLGFTLLQKYEQTELDEPSTDFGLTEKQRRTLVRAVAEGYYKVPRDVDLDALADELEISHQAASERLRRAIDILVHNTIYTPDDEGAE
ncbi:helix-turn-helix domain-containing protein [Halomarina ordinaria]|uniref:Helix-turn-helix domain-containing protein n=1 Tax=Halomarina ordinaria TaxID=3033939 RepID=A0ABD5U8W6_9EURY|nr:helix-turn-helix domain-containing protein [Halomarina sp. PSRA2]